MLAAEEGVGAARRQGTVDGGRVGPGGAGEEAVPQRVMSVVRVDPKSASGHPVVLVDDSGERVLRRIDPAAVATLAGDAVRRRGRRDLGRALFDLVHDPSLNGWVYLDVQDEELRALPWELMIGPDGRRPFLAEGWVRGVPEPCPRGDVLVPIRLLVVLGNTCRPGVAGPGGGRRDPEDRCAPATGPGTSRCSTSRNPASSSIA